MALRDRSPALQLNGCLSGEVPSFFPPQRQFGQSIPRGFTCHMSFDPCLVSASRYVMYRA